MGKKHNKILIQGITESGEKFRPSDWAERMSGKMGTFKRHRIHYSPMLQPTTQDGNRCVVLDPKLEQTNPELYQSILDFAKSNHLKICDIETNDDD